MGKGPVSGISRDSMLGNLNPSDPTQHGHQHLEASLGEHQIMQSDAEPDNDGDDAGFNSGRGSKQHPISGAEVNVEAAPVEITGTHSVLTGQRNKKTGQIYPDKASAESGLSPEGDLPFKRSDYLKAKQAGSEPVYNQSIVASSGEEHPVGLESDTPSQKMSSPGTAEFVGKHGSIQDMSEFESKSGIPLTVADDVRTAVDKAKNNVASPMFPR